MQPTQLPYILTFHDLVLGPIFFLIILFFITRWKNKFYQYSPIKKYILPAIILKLGGCVILSLLYHFVYGYGDMFTYFTGATEIWNAFNSNPYYGFELIFKDMDNVSPKALEFTSIMSFKNYFPLPTEIMFRLTGLIGLLGFGAYLPIAFIYTTLCFIGCWRIFECFYEEFPQYHKQIAIGCLFIPSTIVWGGCILKDPLCVFGLGIYVQGIYAIMKKRANWKSLIQISIGLIVLISLKDYIFYMTIPATVVVLYQQYVAKSKFKYLRITVNTIVFIAFLCTIYWFNQNTEEIGEFFFQNFTQKTEVIQGAITQINQDSGGSAYELPNVTDYSLLGILSSYFLSLFVTLFRPFIWESKNIMVFMTALESSFVLILTIKMILRLGFLKFFSASAKSPILLFGLIFVLCLAPLVGFISFNFGTLVRYKLPIVPFYYTYILLLWASNRKKLVAANG
jgi:hypothetical protein